MWVEVTLVSACISFAIYLQAKKRFRFLRRRGVVHTTSLSYPVFGYNAVLLFKIKSFIYHLLNRRRQYGSEKYIRFYTFTKTAVLIRDPTLIDNISKKDSNHFENPIDANAEDLVAKNVFSLEENSWRQMRRSLSPAFTEDRISDMLPHVNKCARQIMKYLVDKKSGGEGRIDLEMCDIFNRYACDVVASVAFAIDVNSVKDPNNAFYVQSARLLDDRTWTMIKGSATTAMPPLLRKIFKIPLYERDAQVFYMSIINYGLQRRLESRTKRKDVLNMLLEIQMGTIKRDVDASNPIDMIAAFLLTRLRHSDEDMANQVFSFFFGGFDTVSALLCHTVYELASNKVIQDKLWREIYKLGKDELSYEDLQNLKYMDMVISEVLRFWPSVTVMERTCKSEYVLPPPLEDGNPHVVKEGDSVYLSILGLHLDPNHWEDPSEFDPERFNEHNREKIKPSTYMPFGAGAQGAKGSTFALITVKVMLYHMMKRFKILPNRKSAAQDLYSRTQAADKLHKGNFYTLYKRINYSPRMFYNNI